VGRSLATFLVSPGFTAVLVALGAALRLRRYLANPSFFQDEAALALNVMDRGFAELVTGLDHQQAAPPLFLWMVRAVAVVLGHGEMALRLIPLLSSLLSLGLFACVARALLRPAAAPLAVALFALCDAAILQASTFKQYSTDLAVTLGLVLVFTRSHGGSRAALSLGAIGAVAIWLSHPAVIVLVSIGAGIALQSFRAGERRSRTRTALLTSAWCASFALLYAVHLRDVSGLAYMRRFWADAFLPIWPPGVASLRTWWEHFSELAHLAGVPAPLAAVLTPIGVLGLWRRFPAGALALALPLALTAVLACAERYPFADRLILFLVPSVLMLSAEGAVALGRALATLAWPAARPLSATALGLLAAGLFWIDVPLAIQRARTPQVISWVREASQYLRTVLASDDVLYIGQRLTVTYLYYRRSPDALGLPSPRAVSGGWPALRAALSNDAASRVWLLFERHSAGTRKEEDKVTAAMNLRGRCTDDRHWQATRVYGYEVAGKTQR
jgi:hypothetical protein